MKSTLLLLILFFIGFVSLKAQTPVTNIDSLIYNEYYVKEQTKALNYENSFWGLRVYKNREALRHREVYNLLQAYPNISTKYKNGRNTLIIGDIIGAAGLLTLGAGLFTTVNAHNEDYGFSNNDKTLGYSLITGGLIAIGSGVLLFFNGQNKMKLAINMYNDNMQATSLQLGLTPNGVGLFVQF